MTQAKISIQNLYYTYEDGIEALRDISLEIPANEIFVLLDRKSVV